MGDERILIGPSKIWRAPTGEANPSNALVAYGDDWGGNWVYMGNTLSPVAVVPEQVTKRFRKAGRLGPVRIHSTNAGVKLQALMAEQSGDLLKLVWGGTGTVLNAGIESQPVGFQVVPTVYKWGLETEYRDENDVLRPIRYFFHRGIIRWASDFALGKRVVGGIPIEIDVLTDTTQPAGQEFGSGEVPAVVTLPTEAGKILAVASTSPLIEDLSMPGLSLTDGDLIFLHFYHESATETITPPSGFTEIASTLSGSTRVRIYYKVASSEPSTYVMDGTEVTRKFMIVSAWRGTGALTPDQVGAQVNASGAYNWPSITPIAAQGTLFYFMRAEGTSTQFSPPSGLTEAYDISTPYGNLYLMTAPYVGVGATATQSATRTAGTDDTSIVHTINAPIN